MSWDKTQQVAKAIRSSLGFISYAALRHMHQRCQPKQIYIDTINGYTEHLHCLFGLNADMTVSKALQLMKGESAYWVNKNQLIKSKFEWADEYFAVSVSESIIDKVRLYIQNQEEHHRKTTFAQEYDKFFRKYKFEVQG